MIQKIGKKVIGLVLLALALIVYVIQQIPRESAVNMSAVNAKLQEQPVQEPYGSVYEVFVYSYEDTDGDGIGDLNGITEKLDYIHDLGFRGVWLMPVCPSPTYHKYDVADYMSIDPQYGTMEDFQRLVQEAHSRDMKVILDLVLNHTSVQHPWFTKAAEYMRSLPAGQEPDPAVCPYAEYYRFSRNMQGGYAKLADSDWYYEARFWEGMPDLNLDNEAVRKEIAEIMKFWIDKGTDGFRLDAVTSYYTGDHEKNIQFLSWVKKTAVSFDPDCYIVCEGWENRNTYAQYYASGVDSMFDFSFADVSGVITSTLLGRYKARDFGNAQESEWQLYQSYGSQAVNAPFYTNHDMGRSAGYYATDDGSKTKLAQAMNLLMSGNVFLYYGEEIGMKGAGKDENKRAPMYWTQDPDVEGMTQGPPGMDEVAMKFAPLDEQMKDPYSIVNYVKEVMRIRNAFPVIACGRAWVHQDLTTDSVCMIMKEDGVHEPAAIIYNISDQVQTVDLSSTEFHALRGVLTVNEDAVAFSNDILTLPAWGCAVLTEQE